MQWYNFKNCYLLHVSTVANSKEKENQAEFDQKKQ